MPIYEYKCQQCGLHFEKRQSVSDEPLSSCEKCHGKLEKQWSLSGFQFKGAGWYVTDYAGKKSSPPESTAATESASNTKDDVKPAKAEPAKSTTESVSKSSKE
jgi:putative FmdB family regulatory protein